MTKTAKKNQEQNPEKVGSLKKTYSHYEKKQYVLSHLGTQTYSAMAKARDCSERDIYLILAEIRKERDTLLIHKDLVAHAAEEQLNRLNTAAKTMFTLMMLEVEKIQKDPTYVSADIINYQVAHGNAERALTKFLMVTGVYPMLQNNSVNAVDDPQQHITVVFNSGLQVQPPKAEEKEVNPQDRK